MASTVDKTTPQFVSIKAARRGDVPALVAAAEDRGVKVAAEPILSSRITMHGPPADIIDIIAAARGAGRITADAAFDALLDLAKRVLT